MTHFDRSYYERFYLEPSTAVSSKVEVRRRAQLIGAAARHLDVPVKRILDAGCGTGALRAPIRKEFPRATWLGIEASAYACRGLLYFNALTREDWDRNCIRSATDRTPHLRDGDWYRRELDRSFVSVGLGIWVRLGTPVALWELERGP